MTKRVAIYSRVSTDAQERDGTSLDTQERACAEYATGRGWAIVDSARDTASGFSLERLGLDQVRRLASTGKVDVVLVYALDRLSRKQTHVAILVEEMEQLGVALEFVTEEFEKTAVGQLIRSVKAFAAEFEREKIAERTMRGKAERARSGRLPQGTGAGLYGYLYNRESGRRQVVESQADVVHRLFTEFAAGAAIVSLANTLNAEAVPTMKGKMWSPATIFHLLKHEAYAGRTTYRRTRVTHTNVKGRKHASVSERSSADWIDVPDGTPAIVERELFDQVQARLRDPERLRKGRRVYEYRLSGRVRCDLCGASMVGQTLQGGRYRYYRCRKAFAGPIHDRCASRYARADTLESAVLAEIAEVLSRPDIVRAELGSPREAEPAEAESVRKRETLERQRLRLLRLYQLGQIDDAYLDRELVQLRMQEDAAQPVPRNTPTAQLDDAKLDEVCARVREWVLQRPAGELAVVAAALQIAVSVGPGGGELRGVIPEYAPADRHADVCSMVIKPIL